MNRTRTTAAGSLLPFTLALFALGCGDSHGALDGGDGSVNGAAVDVETSAPTLVRAGDEILVQCTLVDEMGITFAPGPELRSSLRFVPIDSVERQDDGRWIAVRAGEVEVSCVFESLRLSDDTPSVVEIVPGAPARVFTSLDFDSVEAGGTSRATCDVFDAYGNRVEDAEPTVRADPAEAGNAFEGTLGTFTAAGQFDVYCDVAGAESEGARIEVRPGLPASLVISRVPDQTVYGIGQVIDLLRIVEDQYGNPVPDANVPVTSDPEGQQLGDGRFRYSEDGLYTVTATVAPPTHDDLPLTASTVIIVDGNGPQIGCEDPFDGALIDMTPGGRITFHGTVNDVGGVESVMVNGAPAELDHFGAFEAPLDTEYGINFIDIAAVDGDGREASRTCAFLVSDFWSPDTLTLSDTLSLRLRQAAFDDRDHTGGLNSLNDILFRMLNSNELQQTLHTTLLANNPLKPDSCDQRVLGVCVLSSRIRYLDSRLNGSKTTRLDLVDDGLRAVIRVEDLGVQIRADGRVAGIGYDTTGWMTFDFVEVEVIFNTRLSGGRPAITVRPGSVQTDVGSLSTSFNGLDGAIVNIAVTLFNGAVRNLIADLVSGYVTDNFNGILDGVFAGLDVSTLGTSFSVPRLGGGSPIDLSFGLRFSSLDVDPQRALFGIGTRFRAPPAHARPTFGAPLQAGARIENVSGSQPAAVAVHEVILNQALHALWRGGFFDMNLSDASGLGLPAGVQANLSTGLTPVAIAQSDGRVELSLGAMSMFLVYPDLFAEPVQLTLGVRASMATHLTGDDLTFDDFRIDELFFSTDLASLDMSTRDTIEGFLRRLLERIIEPALNDALPAIPIPRFTLPAAVSAYGLPGGAQLGITDPALQTEPPHFNLRGSFEVR